MTDRNISADEQVPEQTSPERDAALAEWHQKRFLEANRVASHALGAIAGGDIYPKKLAREALDRLRSLQGESPSGTTSELVAERPKGSASESPALLTSNLVSPERPNETFSEADALRYFEEYFVKNYPGPSTIISNPKWHAPKIFRAALYAIRAASHARPAAETTAPRPIVYWPCEKHMGQQFTMTVGVGAAPITVCPGCEIAKPGDVVTVKTSSSQKGESNGDR